MELIGMQVAVIVVTISIIIAGIALGIGKALGYRRIEQFGIDELFQSVLNAAIVGSAVVVVESIKATTSSLLAVTCQEGADALGELSCIFGKTADSSFLLFQEMLKMSNILGYYQNLVLDFGSFSIQPLANLGGPLAIIASQLLTLQFVLILLNLNIQLLSFFAQNGLAMFFPIGLVLRSFFATRRIGGFLIAFAIGFYAFYPLFILAFPNPDAEVALSVSSFASFNNNSAYAVVPLLDLNNNYAIASKIDNMSFSSALGNASGNTSSNNTSAGVVGIDLTGDISFSLQKSANAVSKLLFYSVIAPLISLLITIVFIKELTSVLGSEFSLPSKLI
ncbi:TPA: hypothetical protein HA238_04400 [Candidatus Micrarchaeota archaeon]|nr:hypothetical protein [Candidatus Micrarchaeota archaeon]